jgi:hypothetical protein
MQDIGFDILSDLRLEPEESFNWENKASSLYCLVPGNVSADPGTVIQTLSHLTNHYQGVFYVPGNLEYQDSPFGEEQRTDELNEITSRVTGVIMLYQNVVIVDGVAVLGINGWADGGHEHNEEELAKTRYRLEDTIYLRQSIHRLQKHLDVKKIIVLSNGVPMPELYYGEQPDIVKSQLPLNVVLESDTEKKVSHWVFGSYNKSVDTVINNISYINHPYVRNSPYWPKRITLTV